MRRSHMGVSNTLPTPHIVVNESSSLETIFSKGFILSTDDKESKKQNHEGPDPSIPQMVKAHPNYSQNYERTKGMAGVFAFKCANCDELHEGSPSFSFRAPDPYLEQPKDILRKGLLNSDLCCYKDQDGMHYFVRACLEIPIHGIDDPFLWGVWISVNEIDYYRYLETYEAPDPSESYFGWLCNRLPFYEDTYAMRTRVHQRTGGERPLVKLEKSKHPLSWDFAQGISIARAQEISEQAMHR